MKAFTDSFELLLTRKPPAAESSATSAAGASHKRRGAHSEAPSSSASSLHGASRQAPLKIDIHSHILPRAWPMLEGINIRLRHEADGSIMEWKVQSIVYPQYYLY
jgi:hypothetical protein